MSHLVAIAYPDVATATEVRNRLTEMQRENRIQLDDAVVVEKRHDDKIRLHQINNSAGRGAASGMMWGGLIGLVFLAPFIGTAVGAAAGATGGAMSDPGIDNDFMKQLGKNLQPGGAALFLLVTQSTPDKIISEVGQHGGKVVKTSLGTPAEEHLREAMQVAQIAQSAQAARAGQGGQSGGQGGQGGHAAKSSKSSKAAAKGRT